jgi:glycosyltransferase involved in cell wall biosynthesis
MPPVQPEAAQLIIPCYNERVRLDPSRISELLAGDRVLVWLVDDGSTDDTWGLLSELAASHPGKVQSLRLPQNRGKAEAVREGLRRAIHAGARVVGYTDADFSTPPGELLRLLGLLESNQAGAVIGSRVARIGSTIEHSTTRYLLGRVFATLAALTLREAFYDTQCGAKWFRSTAALSAALETPFASRWAFDVELLGRLLGVFGGGPHLDRACVLEAPVHEWHHVRGSKVTPAEMSRALREILGLLAESRQNMRG